MLEVYLTDLLIQSHEYPGLLATRPILFRLVDHDVQEINFLLVVNFLDCAHYLLDLVCSVLIVKFLLRVE